MVFRELSVKLIALNLLVWIILQSTSCLANENKIVTHPIHLGEAFEIESHTLTKDISLQLYLPPSYAETDRVYPVLYVLDGDKWFLQAVSQTSLFSQYDSAPELIVVGISIPINRYRFYRNANTFEQVLNNEVFNAIDSQWRTSDEKLLFGWQYGAAAVVHLLATQNSQVTGYIAASPFPLDDALFAGVKKQRSMRDNDMPKLLFSSSIFENHVRQGTVELENRLQDLGKGLFDWQFLTLRAETSPSAAHRTTPLNTLYHGLRFYYRDYAELEFESVDAYLAAGGLEYVNAYYQNRADKYGVSPKVSEEGMFNLVRMALNDGHFPVFHQLMEYFASSGFLNNVNFGWVIRYARFYLNNNDHESASKLYRLINKRFPQRAEPLKGLGDAARLAGAYLDAERYYKKAIALGKTNNDENLRLYQAALKNVISLQKEKQ